MQGLYSSTNWFWQHINFDRFTQMYNVVPTILVPPPPASQVEHK